MVSTEIVHLRQARDHWEDVAAKATRRCETLEKEVQRLTRITGHDRKKLDALALDARERLE